MQTYRRRKAVRIPTFVRHPKAGQGSGIPRDSSTSQAKRDKPFRPDPFIATTVHVRCSYCLAWMTMEPPSIALVAAVSPASPTWLS